MKTSRISMGALATTPRRVSALKRLGASSNVINNNVRRPRASLNDSVPVINDVRELLSNRNKRSTAPVSNKMISSASSFDARQLLSSRQSFAKKKPLTTTTIRRSLPSPTRQRDQLPFPLSKKSVRRDDERTDDKMVVITGLKDMRTMRDGRLILGETSSSLATKKKKVFSVGDSTMVTIRNNHTSRSSTASSRSRTEPVSFSKTIKNTSALVIREDGDRPPHRRRLSKHDLTDQMVRVSVVNDHYHKRMAPPPTPPLAPAPPPIPVTRHHSPPIVKRLHDAAMQTSSSASRSPIRTSSSSARKRHTSTTIDDLDHEDRYEPPSKRHEHISSSAASSSSSSSYLVRKTMTSTTTSTHEQASSLRDSLDRRQQEQQQQLNPKRTSTGGLPLNSTSRTSSSSSAGIQAATHVSSRPSSSSLNMPATILVTNLPRTVTEDDIIELFGQVGRITAITTLSPGCIQLVYGHHRDGELAVTKYHNRLLDGQFMYVSLQQVATSSRPDYAPIEQALMPAPPTSAPTSYSTGKVTVATAAATLAQSRPGFGATPQQAPPPLSKENGSISSNNQPLKLNQAPASSTTAVAAASSSSSSKFVIDPTFIRQALFQPSNNTANPVQFQVKL